MQIVSPNNSQTLSNTQHTRQTDTLTEQHIKYKDITSHSLQLRSKRQTTKVNKVLTIKHQTPETQRPSWTRIPHEHVENCSEHQHNTTHMVYKTQQRHRQWHLIQAHIPPLCNFKDTGEEPCTLHNSKHTKHTHVTRVQITTLYSDGTTHSKQHRCKGVQMAPPARTITVALDIRKF